MGRKCVLIRNYDGEGNLISMECGKCHEIKKVSEFYKSKSAKDGVNTTCKECNDKRCAEYYKQNVDKIKEQQTEYRKQNADKIKEQQVEYYKQNVDKIKEQKAEYYKQNADKKKEYNSEYYKQNADKIKEQKAEYYKQNVDILAEYYKQNADKIKEQRAEYYKQNADKIKERKAEYRKQNADKIKEYDTERYNSKVKQALVGIKEYVEKEPQRFNYNPSEEIYGVIYLVYNAYSQHYYVGQTTIGFDNRYKNGWLNEHSYKDTVKEDLEKYGEDSFEYTKIFKVAHNQEELDKLEAYYIKYFDSYENGYNETRGNIFTERGKN